jgi:hypothetical protein
MQQPPPMQQPQAVLVYLGTTISIAYVFRGMTWVG